jgi:elongation factor G
MTHEVTDPARVRSVVLVGHTGAGKTTLVEALLAATGAIARPGRVEDGTTVTDHDPHARARHRSVAMAVASTAVDEVVLNLVDTPGHPDLVGELRAGLRAADAALFVVSAVDGLDGATALLWDECASLATPRAIVVTHLDHARADFEESVAVCQRVLGPGVVPLYLPLHDDGSGDGSDDGSPQSVPPAAAALPAFLGADLLGAAEPVVGLIGLLSLQVRDYSGGERTSRPADPEHRELVQNRRADLIEAIIGESEDDELMDRYLAGDEIDDAVLERDLEVSVARGSFFPVLPVVPTTGVGVFELLEVLTRGFPSPLERELPTVTTPDGDPRGPFSCNPSGPLVAEVVRTTTDPYVGRVSLVRVFSGTLRPDTAVHVSGHGARWSGHAVELHEDHDVDERVGALSRPLGATLRPVSQAVAGDLVAVGRLTRAETGDTLSDVSRPLLVEPWVLPEPLLPVAITPATPSDDDRLGAALTRLTLEDPTLRVEHDAGTGQLVLWAMGEAHVALALDRLADRHGVRVEAVQVRVALRETVRGPASGRGRLARQAGGHGQFAVVEVDVEPLAPGAGLEVVDAVVGGTVPRHYLAAVEKGLRAGASRGVGSGSGAGYPLTDVRVTVTGGKAHAVDSSESAFATAAGLALDDAVAAAGVTLLEPVDEVEVTADDEYVGSLMTDLSTRRGQVTGTEPLGTGRSVVRALVPASSLARYAVELRSVAHGTATFTRGYAHHAPVPAQVAARLTTVSPTS